MSKLALSAALAALLASPAVAGGFDGTWSVQLVTESGLCEAQYSYTLSVQDGQVRPVTTASTNGATVSGRVGSDGSVGLTVATAAANGTASGRLQVRGGSGTWRVSGGLCTGRWTARRHTMRTAQAE
ncbi:hypothetical protein HNR00_004744 [Methylorubrum rhodinum]|jgi:hypothetical protein|uniref:Large exoprotein involved in heme utilization or adhesion n=1 Tax=Methylorubrum rhodinum TaxID=29428 RepID=A0A840ZSA2_9HYPH|nr:hypothetical protein [Methylorubrum rhodinum]MBB5760004.1 hypothetical protein [Methylorubrum rhodinum]